MKNINSSKCKELSGKLIVQWQPMKKPPYTAFILHKYCSVSPGHREFIWRTSSSVKSQETFSLLTAREAQEVTFPMAPLKLPTKAPCTSPNRMHWLLWHVITVITPVLLLLCVEKYLCNDLTSLNNPTEWQNKPTAAAINRKKCNIFDSILSRVLSTLQSRSWLL